MSDAIQPCRSGLRRPLFLVAALLGTLVTPVARAQLVPTRYDWDVDLDPAAGTMRSTARVALENSSDQPAKTASLLLYRLLVVRGVRDERGADLPFRQSVVAFDDDPKLQVNHVVVDLPRSLAAGEHTALEVRYDGYLLGYVETGMLYVQDRIDPEFTILRMDSYAYPRPGSLSRAAERGRPLAKYGYTARITVPQGLTVANGGRLEATDVAGARVTFRYSSLEPSWRMDFAVAKYGELAAGAVRVLYLPGDREGATGVAEAARRALDLFSRWFGPRPRATPLTFIEIPDGWGSQADVTTVIQSAAAFRDPARHHEVYHEVSHLWNAPDTDLPSPRWNEGLATFLEGLADQELSGKPLLDARSTRFVVWLRGQLPAHPEWRRTPLVEYGRTGMTDLSYTVGGLFFDLLYRLAGSERFNAALAAYVAECGQHGCNTREFTTILGRHAGVDIRPLVSDWFETAAWTERVERSADIHELVRTYRAAAAPNR